MATAHDQLIQKISRLRAARVAEIEDFVDFLAQCDRDSDRQLADAAAAGRASQRNRYARA